MPLWCDNGARTEGGRRPEDSASVHRIRDAVEQYKNWHVSCRNVSGNPVVVSGLERFDKKSSALMCHIGSKQGLNCFRRYDFRNNVEIHNGTGKSFFRVSGDQQSVSFPARIRQSSGYGVDSVGPVRAVGLPASDNPRDLSVR